MKKFTGILLALIMSVSLCACAPREAETIIIEQTPTPAPVETAQAVAQPETPETDTPEAPGEDAPAEIPPVWDESLNAILDCVTWNVRPGSAGCSLRAIQVASALLDWGTETGLSDDEIYSAVGCYMDTLDSDGLSLYLESILNVYDAVYSLRDGDTGELLEEAGVTESYYPWNERAFRAVEMVSYGSGAR